MIQAICFDQDNTILEFAGDYRDIFLKSIAPIMEDHPELTYEVIYGLWRNLITQERPMSAPVGLRELFKQLGMIKEYDYDAIGEHFAELYSRHVHPIEGLENLLGTLSSNYKLAVITNGPYDMQMKALEKSGVMHYFSAIVISGDENTVVRKPNPEIYALTMQKLGIAPQYAVMIGDKMKEDVEGANNAGLLGIWKSSRVEGVYAPTLSSVHELPLFLQNI